MLNDYSIDNKRKISPLKKRIKGVLYNQGKRKRRRARKKGKKEEKRNKFVSTNNKVLRKIINTIVLIQLKGHIKICKEKAKVL